MPFLTNLDYNPKLSSKKEPLFWGFFFNYFLAFLDSLAPMNALLYTTEF